MNKENLPRQQSAAEGLKEAAETASEPSTFPRGRYSDEREDNWGMGRLSAQPQAPAVRWQGLSPALELQEPGSRTWKLGHYAVQPLDISMKSKAGLSADMQGEPRRGF